MTTTEQVRVWVKTSLLDLPKRQQQRRRVTRSVSGDGLPPRGLSRNLSSDSVESAASAPPLSTGGDDKQPYEWTAGFMTQKDDTLSIKLEHHEKIVSLPVSKLDDPDVLLIANDAIADFPDDLVTLEHFHEPTVVEALQKRYAKGHIYTSTGPVLLALNPFQHLPHVYGEEVMQQYWEKFETASDVHLDPHVYSIADGAFRSMMRGIEMSLGRKLAVKYDQSILVSGESGAGKTVTTKYLMKYLAALSQRAALQASGSKPRAYQQAKKVLPQSKRIVTRHTSDLSQASSLGGATSSIEAQVLQSNPILESFGNARTLRNDNSSRFGKFIEMQFTKTGRLVGTRIDTYLLEKVRLVHQSSSERNYHIFYELLSGALEKEALSDLCLEGRLLPRDFCILNSGTFGRRDGVSDRETYRDLVKAFKVMGFGDAERDTIFSVVAAILHASNLKFSAAGDEDDSSTLDRTNKHLDATCQLMGVSADDLDEALCFYTIMAQGNAYRKSLSVVNAEKGLEALLKASYAALFTYLVRRINDSIGFKETPGMSDNARAVATVGILDIFGFESFETNSFEQLCINYCNEALQQQFNTFMLKNEQAEYANEGLDWDFIKFPENQDVLDLIDHRSTGIMSLLDDMCRAPGATDTTFALDVIKRCEGRPRFAAGDRKSKVPTFTIHHYAGPVEYSTTGFVEKNRDDLPKEATDLLRKSTNQFVRDLADIVSASFKVATSNDTSKSRAEAARPTVGGHFCQQVRDLRSKIDATKPHYIRCIKPNEMLIPNHFDASLVAHQLRCGGILQAVSLTRAGFTLHYTHSDFVARYSIITTFGRQPASGVVPQKSAKETCKALVETLLERIDEEAQTQDGSSSIEERTTKKDAGDSSQLAIQFGKTKVLLKHFAFELLERWLGAIHYESATRLNASFRRHLCRVAYSSVRETFRIELKESGETFETWFKDNREIYYMPRDKTAIEIPNIVAQRKALYTRNASTARSSSFSSTRTKKEIQLQNPAWILVEGLWARNPAYRP